MSCLRRKKKYTYKGSDQKISKTYWFNAAYIFFIIRYVWNI